jgi:hydroxymethylglutaryl-CoA lyase
MIILTTPKTAAYSIIRWRNAFSTLSSPFPYDVRIVEVGPRDGLQNESKSISVHDKLELIHRLESSGAFFSIEVGAFVSPKWVPQMANTDQVLEGLRIARIEQKKTMNGKDDNPPPQTRYSVLVPNIRGLEMAISANNGNSNDDNDGNDGTAGGSNRVANEVAIFGAASEEFSRRNINATIDESMDRFKAVADRARQEGIPVRGYVSTVIACPYEGSVPPVQVAKVVNQMLELGCYEVSLGDTIGVGTPLSTASMLKEVLVRVCVRVLR